MSDRIKGLTVTFQTNITEEESEHIMTAICMIKGVVSVAKHVSDPNHHIAVEQAKREIRAKVFKALE